MIGVAQVTFAAYIAVISLVAMLVPQHVVLATNMITSTSNTMVDIIKITDVTYPFIVYVIDNAFMTEGPQQLNQTSDLQQRIMNTPMDNLVSLSSDYIDPQKSKNMNMTLGLKIIDTGKQYTLQITSGALEFQKSFPDIYDVAVIADEGTLRRVMAGLLSLDDAIESGKLKIDGGVDKLKQFLSVFDLGLENKPILNFSG